MNSFAKPKLELVFHSYSISSQSSSVLTKIIVSWGLFELIFSFNQLSYIFFIIFMSFPFSNMNPDNLIR